MEYYVVLHHHRHGTSPHIVRSPHFPSESECILALDLDFEEHLEESIDIDHICEKDIPTIPAVTPA
jgi:hypothetical protein